MHHNFKNFIHTSRILGKTETNFEIRRENVWHGLGPEFHLILNLLQSGENVSLAFPIDHCFISKEPLPTHYLKGQYFYRAVVAK